MLYSGRKISVLAIKRNEEERIKHWRKMVFNTLWRSALQKIRLDEGDDFDYLSS